MDYINNEDTRLYTSSYRREKNERMNLTTKWAWLTVFVGVAGLYSGLLRYLSLHLPSGLIVFLAGVWVTSLFYLILKD